MKRFLPTALALTGALALAACSDSNDETDVVAEDSVETAADAAMEDIDAEPVVDETVVPAPAIEADTAEDVEEGPSEEEVAQLESAGEAAAAAAADVAAIAAGVAASTEQAAQDGADTVNEAMDAGESAAVDAAE